jgi:hypothetical protein
MGLEGCNIRRPFSRTIAGNGVAELVMMSSGGFIFVFSTFYNGGIIDLYLAVIDGWCGAHVFYIEKISYLR